MLYVVKITLRSQDSIDPERNTHIIFGGELTKISQSNALTIKRSASQ
ncbi:hypothetical protein SynMITS9220_01838 [Synechococcus sp. MIT S9220]|nr:hypothetical protein SynMITS9220_01838 [Synechococcus sp. MIT S9220]